MNTPSLNWRNTAIASAVVVAVLILLWTLYVPVQWGSRDTTEVTISNGQGLSRIATTLKDAGLIRSRYGFILYVKAMGRESDMKAGTYILSHGMNTHRIMNIIAGGLSVSTDIEVLVPEGMNIWEIDKRLVVAGFIKEGELAKLYPHKEGHLFPDTYRFAPGTPLQEIVDAMEGNFMAKAAERLPAQAGSDITVIIASILEKEAKSAEDMATVAGIMEKRIERGMPLQIDATVAYGWCLKRFAQTRRDCDVTQAPIAAEIKIDGAYNTYKRLGLPEGPISNPGIKALKAASSPKSSDYLYYLSTKDGSQIIYSKTYDEHLRNRAKYLGF